MSAKVNDERVSELANAKKADEEANERLRKAKALNDGRWC